MKQLIERAEQLELAEAIGRMTENQLEALAQTLYDVDKQQALRLMRDISIMDMESILTDRDGVVI